MPGKIKKSAEKWLAKLFTGGERDTKNRMMISASRIILHIQPPAGVCPELDAVIRKLNGEEYKTTRRTPIKVPSLYPEKSAKISMFKTEYLKAVVNFLDAAGYDMIAIKTSAKTNEYPVTLADSEGHNTFVIAPLIGEQYVYSMADLDKDVSW